MKEKGAFKKLSDAMPADGAAVIPFAVVIVFADFVAFIVCSVFWRSTEVVFTIPAEALSIALAGLVVFQVN